LARKECVEGDERAWGTDDTADAGVQVTWAGIDEESEAGEERSLRQTQMQIEMMRS
jgi:hypothetical protein